MTAETKERIKDLFKTHTFDEIVLKTNTTMNEIEMLAKENASQYRVLKQYPLIDFRVPLETHLISDNEDFHQAFSQRFYHDAIVNLYRFYLNQCEGDCKDCEFIFDIRHMYHRICDEYRDMVTGLSERLGKTEAEFSDIGHWTNRDLQMLFGHRRQ